MFALLYHFIIKYLSIHVFIYLCLRAILNDNQDTTTNIELSRVTASQ